MPEGEAVDTTWPTRLSANTIGRIKAIKKQTGMPVNRFIRAAVENELTRLDNQATAGADRSYTGEIIYGVPCGPWEPLFADARTFHVSEDTADELGVRTGDFFCRVNGQSMTGAGIIDDSVVVLHPLKPKEKPRRGQIVLAEITEPDGTVTATIKRFDGDDKAGMPVLLDGEGEPLDYAKGALITFRATAEGVMSRL